MICIGIYSSVGTISALSKIINESGVQTHLKLLFSQF